MCVFVLVTQSFTPFQLGTVPANLFVNVSVGDVPVRVVNDISLQSQHCLNPSSTVYPYPKCPRLTFQYAPQPIWSSPEPDFLKTMLFTSWRVYRVFFFICLANL